MGDTNVAIDKQAVVEYMKALDCFTWITQNGLELGAGAWRLSGHEYQVDMLQERHPRQCFIKGAQMGITECLVLKSLHGLVYDRYRQGVLYLFPTRDDVGDFSQTRFDPLIASNNFIGEHVLGTDRKNVKKIGSRGHLYLRGARATKSIGSTKKSSSSLKSIPCDRVVFDEMDEIEKSMVILAEERVSHSDIKDDYGTGELDYLGTPTIPDYGIDKLYQTSDQRVWMIKCQGCGKETCLELEFPNCLQRDLNGKVTRVCIHCGKEIYPADGRWIAQYPDRSKELVGWWISQLNSIYMPPTRILNLYEDPPNGDLSEVMNSKLGKAYIPAENRLDPSEVYACCRQDVMASKHEGPTCMGVDVGKVLHVVIAERKTRETLRVVKVCRVGSFNDLHDLIRDFNVKSCVIDLRPEIRKVREFQRTERARVYSCEYVEAKTGMIQWDDRDFNIKCNRTEICDATHELVMGYAKLLLPRMNTELDEFVKEVCSMAKILEERPDTGQSVFRYRKLGADHYRHALNYCLLAADRCGLVGDRGIIGNFFSKRRNRNFMTA